MIWRAGTLIVASSLAAGAQDLAWPVDCTLGETCFIQQYLDRDPGPGLLDAGCGTLTYDGHDGTDIALPNLAAMQKGVAVRAAVAGVVKGVRDGVPDAAPFPPGQDCGNGVLIESAYGQEQYCHLKEGSVTVAKGDKVTPGMALGQVGQSGAADFPHLHLTIRRGGMAVDPFQVAQGCGTGPEIWADDPPYHATGLVQIGIADAMPDYAAVRAGALPAPRAHTGALVLWAEVFGARPGDILRLDLFGPEGPVYQGEAVLDRVQARSFRAQGRKMQAPPGSYRGKVILLRAGREMDRAEVSVLLP